MLVAVHDLQSAETTLWRAFALSRSRGCKLHVLRVLPPVHVPNPLFPEDRSIERIAAMTELDAETDALRRKLTDLFPSETWEGRVETRSGAFVRTIEACAENKRVDLVVMQPPQGRLGADVSRLASALRVPILVARTVAAGECILAATDLRDPNYPVLSEATELGARLELPVVALHNVPQTAPVLTGPFGWPVATLPDATLPEIRRKHLNESIRRTGAQGSILRCGLETPGAILREARSLDADLVVVGTRAKSWLSRFFSRSVAADVIDVASRSVLVVPINEDAA